MVPSPLTQRDNARFRQEGDGLTLPGTSDGRPFFVVEWVPKALCLAIVDQENILVDVAADAELINLAILFASVNYGQFGERSPAHGHGFASDPIVDQFVVVQKRDGIGARFAVLDVPDDRNLVR